MSGEARLAGRTVVVILGSSGIGLETARGAHAEGAGVILTARDPERLISVGHEIGARTTAFDATDFERLDEFFDELRTMAASSWSRVRHEFRHSESAQGRGRPVY